LTDLCCYPLDTWWGIYFPSKSRAGFWNTSYNHFWFIDNGICSQVFNGVSRAVRMSVLICSTGVVTFTLFDYKKPRKEINGNVTRLSQRRCFWEGYHEMWEYFLILSMKTWIPCTNNPFPFAQDLLTFRNQVISNLPSSFSMFQSSESDFCIKWFLIKKVYFCSCTRNR